MLPGTSHQILANPSNLKFSNYSKEQNKQQAKNNVIVDDIEGRSNNQRDESGRQLFQYINQNGAHVFVQQFPPQNTSNSNQYRKTKWADHKQNVQKRAQIKKLYTGNQQRFSRAERVVSRSSIGSHLPENTFSKLSKAKIQQPQSYLKMNNSEISNKLRPPMPSEIIIKSLNKTISSKARPHINNLQQQNSLNILNNMSLDQSGNFIPDKGKSASPTSTIFESRNFSQMFNQNNNTSTCNNNNNFPNKRNDNQSHKEINTAYGNRIKRHYHTISMKHKEPIRVHIKTGQQQYQKKELIFQKEKGVLFGNKKSIAHRESSAQRSSLAKQNARKIKNVVHRLSLSNKVPVFSKRKLKMMQDCEKIVSYVPLKMTQKVLKPNFNQNPQF